jgi:hypothetical protein
MPTGQAIIFLVLELMYPAWERISTEDWRSYAGSEFGLYQYDAGDVHYLSNTNVRVRQKLVLSDRGRANLVQEFGSEYEKAKEIIVIREIDCPAKRICILGLTYVGDEGRVIKRESYESIEWDVITPDSVDAVLYHAICEGNGLTHK